MSIPVTEVRVSLFDQLGEAAVGARVRLVLSHADIDDDSGIAVQPVRHDVELDDGGEGSVDLWPNERGRKSSRYRVAVYRQGFNDPYWQFYATVPESGPVDLTSIVSSDPYPPISESRAALESAQASAAEASAYADAAEQSATAAAASATAAEDDATTAATARDAAEQAQTAAETARDAAQAAQAAAESASDDSTTARDAAQVAQAAAEAARDEALAAQAAAEAAAAAIPSPLGEEAGRAPLTDGADGYSLQYSETGQRYQHPVRGPEIVLPNTLRQAVESETGGRLTVLYDSAGNPNVMHVLPRFTYEDLGFSTELGSGTATAFDLGAGAYRSEIFIAAYPACDIGGLGCSLPHQEPWVDVDWDESLAACSGKGAGWHMMTAHEWAAVALWCMANGFQPRGNTNHGRAHDATHEVGVRQDGADYAPGDSSGIGNTLAGSGPATWRHDGTVSGIADLVGNIWEWQWGMKIVDGEIFLAPNNDHTLAEASWSTTGKFARGDINAGNVTLAEAGSAAGETVSTNWADTYLDVGYTSSQLLRRTLVEPAGISPQGRWYTRDDGERFPVRGGARANGGSAGLAALYCNYVRGNRYSNIGFRPAFVI